MYPARPNSVGRERRAGTDRRNLAQRGILVEGVPEPSLAETTISDTHGIYVLAIGGGILRE